MAKSLAPIARKCKLIAKAARVDGLVTRFRAWRTGDRLGYCSDPKSLPIQRATWPSVPRDLMST